ncbi:uncharacterized protein LOC133867996 [Alnus glutinosa]|uniref:uncharacterized protein LOC133867996 n=1 Tax=Alnus glutinosa TaxID=3517 RepID=UPI002D77BE81|nr:uncharacterized protein LOC133867996 [Alnus glutinosa]XP_062160767.1 uncharacterized protein LOC133867996 [Alnus glutinosa]XP_062160768.1 uncharacterized protein LOC133867996 [Alnus glutinosa]XP_062160769.1 uncharacterized protein LOC133867996 [Alnus glutinosa]XP_062160770.1 uncharacterized protein LOC133867996 [Alnus glutinosa]
MTSGLVLNFPFCFSSEVRSFSNYTFNFKNHQRLCLTNPSSLQLQPPRVSPQAKDTLAAMEAEKTATTSDSSAPIKLLFVEMGVGYDQHGQDITAAAMRACRDAISSNSIPAFRRGSIPGVTFDQMKLQIKLGVPNSLQQSLDIERVKSVFPYGKIVKFEVVDGGLICSSGVHVEEMGDKNDDCYIVNAAVYVGY